MSEPSNIVSGGLTDEAATGALGRSLAARMGPGDVVALWGGLGAGKSTLARAFIRALTSEDEDVPSPTFTLVQTYDGPTAPIWHFDLYRLDSPDDVWELDIEDALHDISLIEWPDRMGRYLPQNRLDVLLEMPNANADASLPERAGVGSVGAESPGRIARLVPRGTWNKPLEDLG
jgi:tRNA threonylcarbamoyladenosine biosynthesis protein TsaE